MKRCFWAECLVWSFFIAWNCLRFDMGFVGSFVPLGNLWLWAASKRCLPLFALPLPAMPGTLCTARAKKRCVLGRSVRWLSGPRHLPAASLNDLNLILRINVVEGANQPQSCRDCLHPPTNRYFIFFFNLKNSVSELLNHHVQSTFITKRRERPICTTPIFVVEYVIFTKLCTVSKWNPICQELRYQFRTLKIKLLSFLSRPIPMTYLFL